jgi:hypothetical protein
MAQMFRFVDSANDTVGGRHYDIRRDDGATAWTCDTTGPAVNETIGFVGPGERAEFTLVPERRVMNRGFTLHEGESGGVVLATLTTRGFGHEWKLCAAEGAERFRIVDPTGKVEATLRFLFEGFTDRYALVADGRIVGRIGHQVRPKTDDLPGGVRGLLRRLVRLSDWTLTLEDDTVDSREAVAAALLLLERQVRGRGGMN